MPGDSSAMSFAKQGRKKIIHLAASWEVLVSETVR
jgi:hypothetical protein